MQKNQKSTKLKMQIEYRNKIQNFWEIVQVKKQLCNSSTLSEKRTGSWVHTQQEYRQLIKKKQADFQTKEKIYQ